MSADTQKTRTISRTVVSTTRRSVRCGMARTGQLLASVMFSGETSAGWQQVNLPTPVAIGANTTYLVSYHTDVGGYALDQNYFATAGVDNAPLHALRDGQDGANGIFSYGPTGFPTQTHLSSNYWVDVVFNTVPVSQ